MKKKPQITFVFVLAYAWVLMIFFGSSCSTR